MIFYKTYIVHNRERVIVWKVSLSHVEQQSANMNDLYQALANNYDLTLYTQFGITYVSSKNSNGVCKDADISAVIKGFAKIHNFTIDLASVVRDDAQGSVSFQAMKVW